MELQEKVPVPIFTEVDKDVFLREIYPKTSSAERPVSRTMPGEVDS